MGRGASLGDLLATLERRVAGWDLAELPREPEPVRCVLPGDHSCLGGWHVRPDRGQGTAYERCPRWQARRAEVASLAFSSNLSADGLRARYGAPLASRLLSGALAPSLRGRDYRQSSVR
jgi:hypothetical protein